MNALLLPLALVVGQPADDWKAAEAAHLDEHQAGDVRLRPGRRGVLLAGRQEDHLPGRGEGHRQPVLPDLRHGPGDREVHARSAPASGQTTCGYFRPDGKKIIFASSHVDPDAKKHQEAEIQAAGGGREEGRPPAVLVGLRPAHEDLRGQPRRHRPEVPDAGREGVHRRGELLGRRQADRLLAPARRATRNSTS